MEIKLMHPDEKIITRDIEKEMRTSFMDYSMSVIVARALPDVRDGLKPVHRRILYSQFKEGLTPDKPYKKCAATVGAVIRDFHPHGDQGVYDALVRMAQNFSLRYPLVDGHGNFGSIDGDKAAAYRYTEARLSRISEEMLRDINKDTIDFVPNYDDSEKEPSVLPSRLPNLLLNGSSGIAVGMAADIPPHNLNEVSAAIQMLIDNPDVGPETLMSAIKGPDFPTGGIIMGHAGIRSAYYTGRGKITLRGRAEIQERDKNERIIITEIPYMLKKENLLVNIGNLIRDKKIDGISAMRDESDRTGMKIVIDLTRGANSNVVLNKLYSFTQLQVTIGVIMLALVDGVPRVLTLKQMLEHYLAFQEEVVTRRTRFDLRKAEARAHILEGFMLVINHIDEVIRIIRGSDDPAQAKQRLIERFGITEIQAEAIAQMRIIQLTKLGRIDIEEELAALNVKISELTAILQDRTKILTIISEELAAVTKKFGDERRTSIEAVSGEVDIEDLIPVEECVLTYTNKGYIKRQLSEVYNLQKRGGKGVSGMKQREEDFVENIFISSTHDNILFVTNFGNMYKLKCYEIPEGSKQSRGTNIVNLLNLSDGEQIAAMLKTSDFAENKYFVCVTRQGLIKRTALSNYKNVRKNGLRAITLNEGDEIAAAHLTEGDSSVLIATAQGYAIHFEESRARDMGRTARGVRSIRLREGDFVVGAAKVYDESCTILTVTERGMGRRAGISSYRKQNRGGKGLTNYRITPERGQVCGIRSLYEDDDVILINDEGVIIRIRANDLRVMGRYACGVRVMRLGADSRVVTFTRTEHDEGEDFEEVEVIENSDDEAEAAALEAAEAEEIEEIEEAEQADDEE
ncbi:MAG: DNA gyrase subunit A [Oscillospiraceae bacterium]|nr:DNA gyrase subunit A [Oscillospiraceae bacterium]